jgi:hypothetical protein
MAALKSELNFPIGRKDPLYGTPERWDFAVHLLDAIFEMTWSGAIASPQVSPNDDINKLLDRIGEAFRDGATPEHRHAMTDQPHYVLLRKDYYTRSLGYQAGSSETRQRERTRPSLIQLMAGWAIEFYKAQQSFRDDIASLFERLSSDENSSANHPQKGQPFWAYPPTLRRLKDLEAELGEGRGRSAMVDEPFLQTVKSKLSAVASKELEEKRLWDVVRKAAHFQGDLTKGIINQPAAEFLQAARRRVRDECEDEVWAWSKVYITDHTSTPEMASEALKASEPVMEAVFSSKQSEQSSASSMGLINLGKDWLCNCTVCGARTAAHCAAD